LAKKFKFKTGAGTARYPHISSPDTKWQYATGKYTVKLVQPAGDPEAQALVKAIDEASLACHGKKNTYKPYSLDEDTNEYVFVCKTKFPPAIFDSRNRPIKAGGPEIGTGSVIRLMGNICEYDKGVTLQFNQVQVIELNGFGTSAFDVVDGGYDASEDDGYVSRASTSDDADDDDSDQEGDETANSGKSSALDI